MRIFSREPVLQKIYLLFFLSGAGIFLILFYHLIMEQNERFYQEIERNERVKTSISLFVQQTIRSLQNQFQYMLLAASEIEVRNANAEIIAYIDKVQSAVDVIEHGGEHTEQIFVNFGYQEQISQTFIYRARENDQTSLSAIEMRTNLARLEDMRLEYFAVMLLEVTSEKMYHNRNLILFHKKIAPFFTRLVENSNRLYIESLNALSMAEKKRKAKTRLFKHVSLVIVPLFLCLSGLVAARTMRDTRRLIREHSNALIALISTNENLEHLISERTIELQQEIIVRKQAEKQAASQAKFLTTVIESLRHPFFVVNASDYSISMANKAAYDEGFKNGTHCHSMLYNQGRPCLEEKRPCLLRQVITTHQPVIMEHVHPTKDNKEKIVEAHGYPIFNDHGEVVQMIEYTLDITEKKLAQRALEASKEKLEQKVLERTQLLEKEIEHRTLIQEELQTSERHFRKLIEGIRDIIVILDKKGIVTYIAPSVDVVLGYSPHEVVGQAFLDFVIVEKGLGANHVPEPSPAHYFATALASTDPLIHQVRDAKGELHTMETSVQDKFDDRAIGGYLLTSRDVTARVKAEEMHLRLTEVIEQNPSSVVITDTSGKIEYVNPQFERITGYKKEEAIGANPRVLQSGLTPPQLFKDMYSTIGKGEVWQGEFVNKKRNGELYTENVIVAPIKNDRGKITHYVALKENITELKKAREQAESANKAKSEFLSRMSHELRTPLNAVIGFSQLLLDNKQGRLSDKQIEQITRIHSAGEHLEQMITKILDLSKVEIGTLTMQPEPVLPLEVINDCVGFTEHLVHTNHITVIVDESVEHIGHVYVDRMRFKQVMVNLISNAVKYNSPHGTVTISASVDDQVACLVVQDTGIGIPPERQKDLFIPFTRLAEDALSIEGTGIGLAITKQLLESMHGSISVTSEMGKGSAFTVTLPLMKGGEEGQEQNEDKESILAGPKMSLYIDDNPQHIAAVRKLLSNSQELTTVIRKKAAQAIQAIDLLKPDLILIHTDFLSQQEPDFIHKVQDLVQRKAGGSSEEQVSAVLLLVDTAQSQVSTVSKSTTRSLNLKNIISMFTTMKGTSHV